MTTRAAAGWIVVVVAPLLILAATLAESLPAGQWLTPPLAVLASVLPNAIVYSAWLVLVAAPVAGVAWGDAPRRAIAACVLFAVASAVLHAVLTVAAGREPGLVAASHTTVASAAIALAGLGRLCSVTLRDPLDAAGVAFGVALLLGAGVLVVGAPLANVPRAVLDAALMASPVVAIASAAGVDLARSGIMYELSPLAHLQFEYPPWHAASAAYLAVGVLCHGSAAFLLRRERPSSVLKGVTCPSSPEPSPVS